MTYKLYCECGYGIKGNSEAHATTNLYQHKKSKLHKKLMEIKSLDKKRGKEEKTKENETTNTTTNEQ